MNKKLCFFILLPFLLLRLAARTTLADSANVSIFPSVVNIIAKPGTNPVSHLSVKNNGDPVLVTFKISPFKPTDTSGHIALDPSLKTPIKFSIESNAPKENEPFLLKTGESADLNITMNIDKDTPEKDYYFTVLAQTTPFPGPEGQTNVQLVGQLGANVLLTVTHDGRMQKKVSAALFNTLPTELGFFKTFYHDSFQKVPYVLILQNDGRNRITPEVSISIKGWNMQKKYRLSSQTILSGSQRAFTGNLTGFFVGPYTISASVTNGEGTKVISTSTRFSSYPFIAFFVVVILSAGVVSLRRSRPTS
jgi:hypothetical protein